LARTRNTLSVFSILTSQLFAAGVSISSITPNSSIERGNVVVTIRGKNFKPGAQVRFVSTDGESVSLSEVKVVGSDRMTVRAPAGRAGTVMTVVVSNPDGSTFTRSNAFRYGRTVFATDFDGRGLRGFTEVFRRPNISLSVAPYFVSAPFGLRIHYQICADRNDPKCGQAHQDLNRWVSIQPNAFLGFPDGMRDVFVRARVYFARPATNATTDIQRKIFFLKAAPGLKGRPSSLWNLVLTSDSIEGRIGLRLNYQDGSGRSAALYGADNELDQHLDLVNGIKELKFDRWYTLELQVKARSSADSHDSEVRLWVDGDLVFEKTRTWSKRAEPCHNSVSYACAAFPAPNVFSENLRTIEIGTQADRVHYLPVDEYRYFDDLVIADAYVGTD
jgi:hypothetical protein